MCRGGGPSAFKGSRHLLPDWRQLAWLVFFQLWSWRRQLALLAKGPSCPALPSHCLCGAHSGLWVMDRCHWVSLPMRCYISPELPG